MSDTKLSAKDQRLLEKWGHPTKYTCEVCGFYKTKNYKTLKGHLKRKHNTSWSQYKNEFGQISHIYHVCKLCNIKQVLDTQVLKYHISRYHDETTIEEYFVKHVKSDLEIEESSSEEEVEDDLEENDDVPELPKEFAKWCAKPHFPCKKCKKFAGTSRKDLFVHIQKLHSKITLDQYQAKYGTVSRGKPLHHKCKICDQKVLFGYSTLKRHFDNKEAHLTPITVEKYFNTIIKQEPAEENEINKPKTDFDKWSRQCEFKCMLCNNYTTDSKGGFQQHLIRDHKGYTVSSYVEEHGIYKEKFHKCLICSKSVRHDPTDLYKHFKRKHTPQVTEKEYFKNYICDRVEGECDQVPWSQIEEWSRRCSYECEVCPNYVAKTKDAITLHVKRLHKMTWNAYKEKFGQGKFKEVFHKCFGCKKSIKHDQGVLKAHIELNCNKLSLRSYYEKYIHNAADDTLEENTQQATEDENLEKKYVAWFNQCRWVCPICQAAIPDLRHVLEHLRDNHQTNLDGLRESQNPLVKEIYHNCRLCGMSILHDHSKLRPHIKNVHKMDLKLYYRDFVQVAEGEHVEIPKDTEEDMLREFFTTGKYNCQICGRKYVEKRSLKAHLKLCHDVNFQDYNNVYKFTRSSITCRICHSLVDKYRSHFIRHLSARHDKMTVSTYFKEHLEKDYRLRRKHGMMNVETVVIEELKMGLDVDTAFTKWRNQFERQCKLCEFSTFTSESFITHLQNSHQSNIRRYSRKHGDFKCEICPHASDHRSSFRLHINKAHKMTWQAYNEKFEVLDHHSKKGKWKEHTCKLCNSTIRIGSIHSHLKKKHGNKIMPKEYFKKFVMKKTFLVTDME